ncbi:MAG: succinylglutamate desuccinylase/aspartoacylase family protein [Cellvibrionaceae bacterium]
MADKSVKNKKKQKPITIGNVTVQPGTHETINVPLAPMYTHNDVQMTLHVINGRYEGPILFVNAAIHGDEINGVEVIRRVLKLKQLNRLRGTLVAIPIVNVYGFLNNSRYLPDGRDLNRSFPGSPKGSLASRIAHTFLNEILFKCTHGIDIHTGARHRGNLPQIRADLSNPQVEQLAKAFGVPVVIDSKIRDGSLREMGDEKGIPILLYEAGEALRFDELSISAGVRGVVNVMREIDMLPKKTSAEKKSLSGEVSAAQLKREKKKRETIVSKKTNWIRAPHSGILRALVPLGAKVEKGNVLGLIGDPLGSHEYEVIADSDGIVIGRTYLPLVHEGEAVFHIAQYAIKTEKIFDQVDEFHEEFVTEVSLEAPENPQDAPIQ